MSFCIRCSSFIMIIYDVGRHGALSALLPGELHVAPTTATPCKGLTSWLIPRRSKYPIIRYLRFGSQ